MFDEIDAAYFLERAREERLKASHVEGNSAADKHLLMADLYEEKARQLTSASETD